MKLSILAVFWLCAELSVHVSADYVVEVTVQSYSNPTNRAGVFLSQPEQCCDNNLPTSNDDEFCTGDERCDNYFRYCLRSFGTSIEDETCRRSVRTSTTRADGATINFSQSPVLGLSNPLTLPGLSTTWQGVQLYVEVMDNDRQEVFVTSDDLVDSFSIDINAAIGSSVPFTRPGRFGLGTLSGSVRVQCTTFFSGEYCNCRSNSCSGRGECVSGTNGITCNCDPEFTGINCQLTNFCYQQDCSERGTCTSGLLTYTCSCEPGYTGRDCEDIDYCFDITCSDGQGRCENVDGDYHCVCDPGYTGRDCEEDIDDCVGINCNGRGTCMDLFNDYVCDCGQSGYTGRDCEVDINECEMPSVCNNRGNCSNTMGSFNCTCQPGFTGQRCATDINECEGITCSGRGNCTDRINGFECGCFPGFTGGTCEINIDDCVGQRCSGNGQCNDLVNSFECDCLSGFTGSLCDINIDDCVGVNCTNGQCVDGIDSFSCDCELGFTGQLCNVLEVRASPGGVIGGVVGSLLVLVLLIALLLVVIAVLVRWRAQRKDIADTNAVASTRYIPGDNPTYEANTTNTVSNGGRAASGGINGSRPSNGLSTITSETAEFDNPIYGSQQSLNDKELSNPIYGDSAFDEHQYETPHGAVYETPQGAMYGTPALHAYASLEQPYQNVNVH